MTKLCVVPSVLIFAAVTAGAQNVPPPPKPPSGPSLEVTMKYIEDKLNGVNFTTIQKSNTGDSHSWRLKITSAQGVPQGCMLSWRLTQFDLDEKNAQDTYSRLSLGDAKAVTVQSLSDYYHQAGFDADDFLFFPQVYRLTIKMQSGKAAHSHIDAEPDGDVTEVVAELPDKEYADRLAKAIVHAIELCGGGDNDPFR
jgi:hypothetical protein